MFIEKLSVLPILLICLFLVSGAEATTVQGAVYAWSDFEKPLKNAIVEVNSTPAQSKVATDGIYSFDLMPGSYVLRAKYYHNNILEYVADEEIRIDREGNYTIDLLLFPPIDQEYEYLADLNLTADIKDESPGYNYVILVSILLFAAIVVFWLRKKKCGVDDDPTGSDQAAASPGKIEQSESKELPDDIHEIYEIILKKGGRTTQKDLRKEVKYGEAKVSLMIADLEDRGMIKKIKRGRSNIIIAEAKK